MKVFVTAMRQGGSGASSSAEDDSSEVADRPTTLSITWAHNKHFPINTMLTGANSLANRGEKERLGVFDDQVRTANPRCRRRGESVAIVSIVSKQGKCRPRV